MARGDGEKWDALMAEVSAHVVPGLLTAARRFFTELRGRYTYAKLEQLLAGGTWDIMTALPPDLEAALGAAARRAVVTVAVRQVPVVTQMVGLATEIAFDVANPLALQRVVSHGSRLIREVSDATREAINVLIKEQLQAGVNPRDVAREIRPLIGLTQSQARTVLNYQQALKDGGKRALQFALRDKRSDAMIRRLATERKLLTPAQIKSLVDRYAERLLKHRAEVIARTESIRALSEGRRLAMDAMLADPRSGLTKQDLVRRWVVAFDERTCPLCQEVPQQNPTGVGYDEPFRIEYKDEVLEFMDAPTHPQCRCVVFVQPRTSVVT